MTGRDYYVVLGVGRAENRGGIRNAFKELALRYHPDRGGPNATRFFQDIVEAYRVLSDPAQRTSYDRGLQHAAPLDVSPPVAPRYHPPPEPLVPAPISILRDFEVTHPSWDEVRDRFLRNFTSRGLPKSRRLDALNLELTISPEAAQQGGAVELGVPVFYPCAACHGSGRDWEYPCSSCGGEGMVEEEHPVRLHLPPQTGDGLVIEVPLRGLGVHNLYLRVLVRVGW